jgi:SpoIID/LytB domain protein
VVGSLFLITSLALSASPLPEEAQLLFSTQLEFGEGGVPLVTVGLMDGQKIARVTSDSGLRIRLSGRSGGAIDLPANTVLEGAVEQGHAGTTRWRVVLEGFSGSQLEAIRESRDRWGKAGVDTEVLERGGIVGFPGHTLDNRRSFIAEKAVYNNRDVAIARAEMLGAKLLTSKPPRIMADPVTRPRGIVKVRDVHSGFVLRQKSLVTISPRGGGVLTVQNVEFGKGYKHHGFEDRSFHGEIILAVGRDGSLAVVNRATAEEILRGVVPSEIFPTAPAAALDAQAISARGELFAQLGVRNLADPYQICATQQCQVYSGVNKETPATNRAVKRTRGKMLFATGDHLVDSVYHACSGGHTENNEHVWSGGPNPSLRGKLDGPSRIAAPWPAGTVPTEEQLEAFLQKPPTSLYVGLHPLGKKVFRWMVSLSNEDVDSFVRKKYPSIGRVREIAVTERGVSGRVRTLKIRGSGGEVVVERELPVRRLFGNLRSGMFIVTRKRGHWIFNGGGYGHGVGMSQYGAMGMANTGKAADQILAHYYTGARVVNVY